LVGVFEIVIIGEVGRLSARLHPRLPLLIRDRVARDPERRVEYNGMPRFLHIVGVSVVIATADDIASGLDAAEVAARVIRL
jgi:hypothetical protein